MMHILFFFPGETDYLGFQHHFEKNIKYGMFCPYINYS